MLSSKHISKLSYGYHFFLISLCLCWTGWILRELRQHDRTVQIIFFDIIAGICLRILWSKGTGIYPQARITGEIIKKELNELAIQFDEAKASDFKTAFGYQETIFSRYWIYRKPRTNAFFHLCSGQILEISEPLNHFEQQVLGHRRFLQMPSFLSGFICPMWIILTITKSQHDPGRPFRLPEDTEKRSKKAFFFNPVCWMIFMEIIVWF